MTFRDEAHGELIDIIQWDDDSRNTLAYRFERFHNQIKNGARLTVREGQAAVFVNEGRIADIFLPGMVTLETRNLPVLSTLLGWKYGFNSPFVAEVYFCSTRQFTGLKWGTSNPVVMRDAEFGAVRIRAFGSYVIRVKDPATLIRQIAGTGRRFTVDEIGDQLRAEIVSHFADAAGQSHLSVLDMAANTTEFGDSITAQIAPEIEKFGIELTRLLIENISLPPEVEAAIDKRTTMSAMGDLKAYTQYNVANSLPDAAKNPGGLAAAGAGLGIGMAMATPMIQALSGQSVPAAPASVPPPISGAEAFFVAVDRHQTGPFDLQTLASQASAGTFHAQTLVWTHGMAQWTPAGQVPALMAILADVPPPLP